MSEAPAPGIHFDVPEAEYRAWDAFHYSAVSSLLRSALHWKHESEHPSDTDQMRLGSLIDAMLFTPSAVDDLYVMRPDTYVSEVTHGRGSAKVTESVTKPWTMNSNTCKAIWAQLCESGRTVVSSNESDTAKQVVAAVRAHPIAADWLERGLKQVPVAWRDGTADNGEETGCPCKGLLDLVVSDGTSPVDTQYDMVVADLKTTNNADRGPFRRTMTNFGWHVQGGLYQDGYARATGRGGVTGLYLPYYIIAAETEPPYGVAVYPVGPDSLATGLRRARQAMAVWQAMRQTGEYPGYAVIQEEIDVLPYALDREVSFNG